MEETSDSFPVYSDPSAKIYEKLAMKRTWDGFKNPPPYSYESFPSALFKDLKQRWKRGWGALRGGPGNQHGGEWIFQGGKLKYAHRMEAVNDHLTADQLLNILKADQGGGLRAGDSQCASHCASGEDVQEGQAGVGTLAGE